MKRAGILDTQVALQRKSVSYSASGEPVETWSILWECWADLKPVAGSELNAAAQWVAREQTQFTVRWAPEIDDFSPLDRIVCPSSDASVSPEVTRSIYDVISVHEPERQDYLQILAARRVA